MYQIMQSPDVLQVCSQHSVVYKMQLPLLFGFHQLQTQQVGLSICSWGSRCEKINEAQRKSFKYTRAQTFPARAHWSSGQEACPLWQPKAKGQPTIYRELCAELNLMSSACMLSHGQL